MKNHSLLSVKVRNSIKAICFQLIEEIFYPTPLPRPQKKKRREISAQKILAQITLGCWYISITVLNLLYTYVQGCELGPGTYQHKSFTEQTTGKVTSLRGPYDLFTGDRNAPVKTGHFAKPVRISISYLLQIDDKYVLMLMYCYFSLYTLYLYAISGIPVAKLKVNFSGTVVCAKCLLAQPCIKNYLY